MSEGRPVPLPIRNVRIERWVQETAAAQSDDRSSRIVSPWPQDAPRTIVREGEYIATPSQHAAQDPAIGSSDTRVDAFRDPLVEPGLSNRRRSPGCPDAPLLDTLTTPDTISPVDSALWAELTRQGLGSLIRPTDDEEIDETEAPGIETAEQNQTAISDVAPSEVSEHSTVVPPSPLFPLRTVSERVAQVSAQDSKLDSQRRRVAYSPSAYSRQTHQSKNWDDGISVNHPYEDVMVRRRSEPLNIAVLSQVEERMRERHFARQQFMLQQTSLAKLSGDSVTATASVQPRPNGRLLRRASQNLAKGSKSAVGFLFGIKEEDMESSMPAGWSANRDFLSRSA